MAACNLPLITSSHSNHLIYLNSQLLLSNNSNNNLFQSSNVVHISSVGVFPKTFKFHHCLPFPKATASSSEEEGSGGRVPVELVEDSKFVPLNADDDQFGPPALLLLGFEVDEVAKVQLLLKDLDGEFLQIILCTEEMVSCSLWQAMNTAQQNLDASKIAKSLPRICFLSGLTGEEMMMFIDAFPDSGLVPPVFAALVSNSADKTVQELIQEVMGDHEMLTARNSA